MGKRPHGIALIISNTEFNKKEDNRHVGGKEDEVSIQKLFTTMHYKVVLLNDLEGAQIARALQIVTQHPDGKLTTRQDREKLAVLSNKDCFVSAMHDSFVLCLMTHGVEGAVQGTGKEQCEIKEIHEIIGSCKNLSNKPKMVFIQACRGEKYLYVQHDHATNVEDSLHLYSTLPGFVSLRNPLGSWYIQAVCDIFNKGYKTKDLDSMIKDVETEVMKRLGIHDGRIVKQKPVTERREWKYKVYFDLECQSTS